MQVMVSGDGVLERRLCLPGAEPRTPYEAGTSASDVIVFLSGLLFYFTRVLDESSGVAISDC